MKNVIKLYKKRLIKFDLYRIQIMALPLMITLIFMGGCTNQSRDLINTKKEVYEKLAFPKVIIQEQPNKQLPPNNYEENITLKVDDLKKINVKDFEVNVSQKYHKKQKILDTELNSENVSLVTTQKNKNIIYPKNFIGLTTEKVSLLLGFPGLRRKEYPAEVWQYKSQECVFEIVFYIKNTTNKELKSEYYEARDRSANEVNPQKCLTDILEMNEKIND